MNGCDGRQLLTYRRRKYDVTAVAIKSEMVSEEEVKLPLVVSKQCVGCKTTVTPLWRCGPAGPKTLCNACGIKYGKSKNRTGDEAIKLENNSEMWEELKKKQKEKQQKLFLIMLQRDKEKMLMKSQKQEEKLSIIRSAAFWKVNRKKRGMRRGAHHAARLLLQLSKPESV